MLPVTGEYKGATGQCWCRCVRARTVPCTPTRRIRPTDCVFGLFVARARTLTFITKSQLISYPCPSNISYLYNYGFLLNICIILQIITGIYLSIHYISHISYSFFIIKHIIHDIYNGSILRYLHSNEASFTFLITYSHIIRSIILQSYIYLFNTWITGIILYLILIVIAFLRYILPWGQMSYWGATVITNVLSFIPDIVEWICGNFFIYNPTLNRFFILHFILPFLIIYLLLFHIFYLHLLSSNNPLNSINTNNKVTFFNYILNKDIYGFLILFTLYYMQLGYGLLLISHPDNTLEVNILITPFHIVPEWYFLSFYTKLKTIPDKNSGICILIITILLFFMNDSFGFIINNFNLGISIYFFFWICFIWISTEIPKVSFICLCRFYILWYLFI